MRFSIIIPVKNEEAELAKCLKFLSNQTFKDFEVIVVNDNSRDNSMNVAKKFDAKIIESSGINSTIGAVRQAGCEYASGEILCNTDADCEPYPDWLEILNNSFKDHYAGIAGLLRAKDGGFKGKYFIYHYNFILRLSHLFDVPGVFGANFAIRRDVFNRAGGFNKNIKLSEDFELALRASLYGKIYLNNKLIMPTSSRRMKYGMHKEIYTGLINDINMLLKFNKQKKDLK